MTHMITYYVLRITYFLKNTTQYAIRNTQRGWA